MSIIDITDRCNLQCIYCCRGDNKHRKINEPSVYDLISAIKQLIHMRGTFIVLQGGEPLLREDIIELINQMSSLKKILPGFYLDRMREIIKNKYKCEDFATQYKKTLIEQQLPMYFISTNGMVYSDDIGEALYNGGFSLDISLDSVEESINVMTRKGIHFRKVVSTLESFAKRIPVNVSCTVTEHNVNGLENLIEFAENYGCISVKFSPVMMVGLRKEGDLSLKEEYLNSISKILDKFKEHNNTMFLNIKLYKHYMDSKKGEEIYKRILESSNILLELHECAAFRMVKEVYIDTKLNVYGCASMKNDESLSMGCLKNSSLKELWGNQKRLSFKDEISSYYEKAGCLGGCTSTAFMRERQSGM